MEDFKELFKITIWITFSMLIVLGILGLVVFAIDNLTEDNYKYIDENNKVGKAVNCYDGDGNLYCRTNDNSKIEVKKYWIER